MDVMPIMRPWLGEEEQRAAAAAIASGWIASGPRVAAFEQAVADAVGARHGVATSSCTTALHLALHALGVGPGDDVVVPSLSFIATANAPRYVGARPVFADVDPVTQNVTAATVQAALTPATRAVVAVHQAGMPARIDEIADLCRRRGIELVEDAACAIGSTLDGRRIGARGLVALSFHPRKLVTTGEGGMLLTGDAGLAARLRRLREHGMTVGAHDRHVVGRVVVEAYDELGFNFRMTDLQAAVGLVQIGRLDDIVAERRRLAGEYRAALEDVPGLGLPGDPPYGTTNYQSYVVRLGDEVPVHRDTVMRRLLEHGIATRRGIMAAHLEPAHAPAGQGVLPVTERLTRRSIVLPLFHGMTGADVRRVADALTEAIEAPARVPAAQPC
jgi:dTDP-4-amino-4,6-dideoxygalactose transaminase